jgi:hypothetical protein
MEITFAKLKIIADFPSLMNPKTNTGTFRRKINIPVSIDKPTFDNKCSAIWAIPVIPAEKTFAGIKKRFKPTAPVKPVNKMTRIFFAKSLDV